MRKMPYNRSRNTSRSQFYSESLKIEQKKTELEKKKKEEEETARVYEEFVSSFEKDYSRTPRLWVGGECINKREDQQEEENKNVLYIQHANKIKPKESSVQELYSNSEKIIPNAQRKRNLNAFLEIIKKEQYERSLRQSAQSNQRNDNCHANLYVRNLNPSASEYLIMKEFSKYGPVSSVKILCPKGEGKIRNTNNGLIAFNNREDAYRALKELNREFFMGHMIQVEWARATHVPPGPNSKSRKRQWPSDVSDNNEMSYYKQEKFKFTSHAVISKNAAEKDPEKISRSDMELLVIPPNSVDVKRTIDILAERVAKHGSLFEKIIMEREISNPKFSFLRDNNSKEHIYYRWKLYSILQGDSIDNWRTEKFQMYTNDFFWIPPPLEQDDEIPLEITYEEISNKKLEESLSRVLFRYEYTLTKLDLSRDSIGKAMVYAINNSDYSKEIAKLITDSLMIPATPIFPTKIARLFLLNDILYNSSAEVPNCWEYRSFFETKLHEIFEHLGYVRRNLKKRLKQEQMRVIVTEVIKAWEKWVIFPFEYIKELTRLFLKNDNSEDEGKKDETGEPRKLDENKEFSEDESIHLNFCPIPEVEDHSESKSSRNITEEKHPAQNVRKLPINYDEVDEEDLSGMETPENDD